MQFEKTILFIEVGYFEFTFVVGKLDNNENFTLIYNDCIKINEKSDDVVSDFEKNFEILKKNIFLIEKKINLTFKEVNVLLKNFEHSIINLSGFRRLNNSQLKKENITYLINSLKSKILETEKHMSIIHIFNTKFVLDNKKINNLPIGLFGNLYFHELSFYLIKNNDLKNLKSIFERCNLKINKFISTNFVEGIDLIDQNKDLETFFKIDITKSNSKIIFFENSSLKFDQNFNFGTDLVINDISKITGIQKEKVFEILKNVNSSTEIKNDIFLDEKYFENKNFRKIKKSLIFEIAEARIIEIIEILILKNINLTSFLRNKNKVFLYIQDQIILNCFKKKFDTIFSKNKNLNLHFIQKPKIDNLIKHVNEIVQYGWKKEAIPIVQEKKSIISRLFDLIFK